MSLLELLGPTAIPSIICLIFGLLMLAIEMFTPGVGVAGVSGLLLLIAVVIMQLGWGNPRVALYVIAITLLIIVLSIIWIIRSLQRGRLSRSFLVLNDQVEATSVPDVTSAKQELVGKSGVTITPLRPSGIAEIEGRRVDVLTAGAFIEKNKPIVVVQAKGLHILVAENKPDETPAETDETQAPADTNA
jgi:membrane-bound serine protease (ClpP class)